MCTFFSCISDGNGKVLFFKPEDIITEMAKGNPNNYQWNSHTSIAHFNKINSSSEDQWSKWEYNPEKKDLKVDGLHAKDDSELVKKQLIEFFEGKNIGFLQNLYNWNSGNWNSGDRNSGDRNSGNGNSGNRNSGDRNSGNWNSGDGMRNSFCSKQKFFLFDKECKESDYKKSLEIDFYWFDIEKWINESDMTEEDKKNHLGYQTTGGFLKTLTYKEAWSKCPKEVLEKIERLKNFNKKVFFEISGIEV